MSDGLAILGGNRVRTKPFACWPVLGAPEERRVAIAKTYNHIGIEAAAHAHAVGYAIPLYRQPRVLTKNFAPYLPNASASLDFGALACPNSEQICGEQGAWLEQSIFLGTQDDMDDIAQAFEKVYKRRGELEKELS